MEGMKDHNQILLTTGYKLSSPLTTEEPHGKATTWRLPQLV